MNLSIDSSISWRCKSTWKKASVNTLWCLLGCSIGDFGTILFFQYSSYSLATEYIMLLAIINGILTSIMLETIILSLTQPLYIAFKTAVGMSLISMISMEVAMNTVCYNWWCYDKYLCNTANAYCRFYYTITLQLLPT